MQSRKFLFTHQSSQLSLYSRYYCAHSEIWMASWFLIWKAILGRYMRFRPRRTFYGATFWKITFTHIYRLMDTTRAWNLKADFKLVLPYTSRTLHISVYHFMQTFHVFPFKAPRGLYASHSLSERKRVIFRGDCITHTLSCPYIR